MCERSKSFKGRYDVIKEIGKGAFGRVYVALDKEYKDR